MCIKHGVGFAYPMKPHGIERERDRERERERQRDREREREREIYT
jgi:hypothetical protein